MVAKRKMGARLIVVYWRHIPAQVIAREGRRTAKIVLGNRFQVAIDRAAMRAGKGSSDHYLEDWRREAMAFEGDLKEAASDLAASLETCFDDERLERMVKAGGIDIAA